MTQSPTDKFIQDGLWRPIEEAPKDGTIISVKRPNIWDGDETHCAAFYDSRLGFFVTRVMSDEYIESDEYINGIPSKLGAIFPSRKTTDSIFSAGITHFRLTSDDRLAIAFKVAVEYINGRAWQNLEPTSQRGAQEALAEINRIAESKGG